MRVVPAIVAMILAGSCTSQLLQRQPASPLTIRYQEWRQPARSRAAVSTSLYRDLVAKSMYSQCRMEPHDSHYFDIMTKRCGGVRAVFRGAARLFLERAASTDYLVPVRLDGQLKWLDPIGETPCD